MKKIYILLFFLLSTLLLSQERPLRENPPVNFPFVNIELSPQLSKGSNFSFYLQLLIVLTVITLSPSIILLMTSFLRISLVLDFIRRALSLQQSPPNQVIMGLALFLTFFTMWPTFNKIYDEAFIPLSKNEINFSQFYDKSISPLRIFMYKQMKGSKHEEIRLFMKLGGYRQPKNFSEVPTHVLISAFILHELKVAFKMGILIFLPFIVIDIIVASILMSMGMIMLPPVMISLPFKLLLFVLVDGWSLITNNLIASFL